MPPHTRPAPSALQFLPKATSQRALQSAARTCQGCPLYKNATQTVFGRGPDSAALFLVGEQPGNEEDLVGEPFVGPAGRLLDAALEAAGIDRNDTYVTNVVKHFSWKPSGQRRLHKKPTTTEISACIPWLEKEIELVRPEVLVCLGATAAQALFGVDFRVSKQRGQLVPSELAPRALATIHPSAVLRQRTSEDRARELHRLTEDLRHAATFLKKVSRARAG